MVNENYIILEQVNTHNLKNINIKIPLNKVTTVSGVSGSGKSSLVFDTLYAEGYRRYVESLSSFSRQYLKILPKPKIGRVYNLPSTIAIRQARSSANVRSTVGTATEINELIRILFTHLGEIWCDDCNVQIIKYDNEKASKILISNFNGQKIIIACSLDTFSSIKDKALKENLQSQGLIKLIYNHRIFDIDEIELKKLKQAYLVIDKLTINSNQYQRLSEALDLAFKINKYVVHIFDQNLNLIKTFYSTLTCPQCKQQYLEPSPALLSFNHPLGACNECQGFGYIPSINWNKVFVDKSSSLEKKGIDPWNFGSHVVMYDFAIKSASKLKINYKKPFYKYNEAELNWLKYGDGKDFVGIEGYFQWLETQKHKMHYRIHAAKYKQYIPCPTCKEQRLNKFALACKLSGLNIAQVCAKTIYDLNLWIDDLSSQINNYNEKDNKISSNKTKILGCSEALKEIKSRINYLLKVGVGYLQLDRPLRTLSGGEYQRINMARCLGNELTDTLYCLDEPSCGLHARDIVNLTKVIRTLQEQGNTVVVVEHDKKLLKSCDYIIELGPQSGHKGGYIVYEGIPKNDENKYFEINNINSHLNLSHKITLTKAATHNLKNIDVNFLASSFVVVCGVSGSGKTSLVRYTLYPMLAKFYQQKIDDEEEISVHTKADSVGPKELLLKFKGVLHVDQSPLSRSTRSNIATYLGIFDVIRKLFAETPMAKDLKLSPSHFSFNVPGGRCEICKGLGEIEQDLSFLGEMRIICPSCNGRRFNDNVLKVKYKGLNLLEVLSLTVEQAREFFFDNDYISSTLDTVIELGLGYICLGQNTSSFSGGEAQRLKLLKTITASNTSDNMIFIFDEPSSGLSDLDVKNLIHNFKSLCAKGHTVIVVEHHLGIIASADWIIEIGPDAADKGGELIYEGPRNFFIYDEKSITAKYLREYLGIT